MLLEATYAEAQGFVEIIAGHFDKAEKLHIDNQSWFKMPEQFEELEKHVEAYSSTNLYFTPSTFTARKRQPDLADKTNIVYIDADTCHPDNFRVAPTFTVETSPGKYQCYWLLDTYLPTHEVSEVCRRISHAHKDRGCDTSSWPANKIMRVPGSMHGKTEPHHRVTLTETTGELFSLRELSATYGDIDLPAPVEVENIDMGELPNAADVASKIPGELMDIFRYGAPDGSDRSAVRYKFEIDLFAEGFTPEEVFVAVQRAASGNLDKFTSQGRPESLWHEVLKAQAAEAPTGELDEVHLPSSDDISFLSPEERAWVEENPTFIDEYVAWVKTRSPLSAETYQRTLSLMVLSCVYGNWAYLTPQFDDMFLNLWCVIGGDTTKSRKSTARRLALELVRHWEKRSGKVIDIGSDATSEALTATLIDRDGQVSLLHRDEFQGLAKELYSKNYLAGFDATLAELYDGTVKQTLRTSQSQNNTKRATTVFNFIALGIEDQIAASLTKSNFQSGFLTRFLWSVADPPAWKPEHEELTQREGAKEKTDDPQVMRFSNEFELARRKWNSVKPKPILADDETWTRWLQWRVESKTLVADLPNESILEPSRDRLSFSILKAAALLAIHGRSDTIRMEHLLPVLAQAEWWFTDMMRMANKVSSSHFEGNVDKLEVMIAGSPNGVMKLTDVFKSPVFKSMRKGETEEHIRSLVAQGRAKEDTHDKHKVLVVNLGK